MATNIPMAEEEKDFLYRSVYFVIEDILEAAHKLGIRAESEHVGGQVMALHLLLERYAGTGYSDYKKWLNRMELDGKLPLVDG